MISFLIKIIFLPVIIVFFTYFFGNVQFDSIWQTIIAILMLAVIGVSMEALLLRRKTFWLSIFLDFASTVVLLLLIAAVFDGIEVTLAGAVFISLIVGVQEYFVHLILITNDK
ncbi:hypothetical protein [Sediminibacillus albus]|uniref:4 TMS phage holin, superfamily IV n=1 Tax=Sediminibacillus albus TaxID=407036 RepID=A0A1G8WW29_9BACI|nr:hypothetical protein [Sediminibacillus albus]SDJ82411.1 hypothetical protein SAMN05216243_1024 [Sediminibacillus albus]